MSSIHPSAIIDSNAAIGDGVEIGPLCVVGPNARIGDNCKISSGVRIDWTELGPGCMVGANSVIGGDPQMYDWEPVESWVKVGEGTLINELAAVHRSAYEGKATIIGKGCYIMTQTHVAHDCILGENVTLTSMAGFSGHVEVGDHAVIGGFTAVHQFVRIGTMAMLGGMSRIGQDVAPYFTVAGVPAESHGLNSYALKKYKIAPAQRKELKIAYKYLARSGLSLANAVEKISEELTLDGPVGELVEFVKGSKRGITL